MTGTETRDSTGAVVYTIGHSNHTTEVFLRLLRQYEITAIADVRSVPYSRMNPQFSREQLKSALALTGISYVFLGRELGARSEDPTCYVDGRVDYGLLGKTSSFRDGLDRVIAGAGSEVVALMCAEKDPLQCHRTILVSRHLVERGAFVRHILADGSLESHEAAVARLLVELALNEPDMFSTLEERIEKAFQVRGAAIAFARPDDESSGGAHRGPR
jgi:uncharacterized protein (DUF488 family)